MTRNMSEETRKEDKEIQHCTGLNTTAKPKPDLMINSVVSILLPVDWPHFHLTPHWPVTPHNQYMHTQIDGENLSKICVV
jgi:hypothetical protein